MRLENSRCLVLNGDYSPLGIIDWKKAIVWSMKYDQGSYRSIEILDFYKDDYINGTNNKKIPIPAVVKTIRYFKFNSFVNFSRKNLFIRDDYTCQYCSTKLLLNQLTYDHIIPRSQWNKSESPTCWTNIVTACKRCNIRKGNKTPLQANMPLKKPPTVPKRSLKYLPVYSQLDIIKDNIPEPWRLYLQ